MKMFKDVTLNMKWQIGFILVLAVNMSAFTMDADSQSDSGKTHSNSSHLFLIRNDGMLPKDVRFFVESSCQRILFRDRSVLFIPIAQSKGGIELRFQGSNPSVHVEPLDRLPTVVNYFQGSETEWRTRIPTFGRLLYRDIWPGVDLEFRGSYNRVKYEFHVSPGFNPAAIQMRYLHADSVRVREDGGLTIRRGKMVLEDDAPTAFQWSGSQQKAVSVRFFCSAQQEETVGFEVEAFDKNKELVIDPAILVWSGYAGTKTESISDGVVSPSGSLWISGITTDKMGSLINVSLKGQALSVVYLGTGGTLGATSVDAIALSPSGELIVAGMTCENEKSFPVKVGPYLTNKGGPDAFVAKLSPDGSSIVYCGYIGGMLNDCATAVAVDKNGCAWVAGVTDYFSTFPNQFPVVKGPGLIPRGGFDTFVAKVRPDGKALLSCGYISGLNNDTPHAITVDTGGNAYVVGETHSDEKSFPVKVGPRLSFPDRLMDAESFIAKVNGNSAAIEFCGYLGGPGRDAAWAIVVDSVGCAYVGGGVGGTLSTVKVGPYLARSSAQGDGYLAKINASGRDFAFCGYLPDAGVLDLALTSTGSIVIVGNSHGGLPVMNADFGQTFAGKGDAFIAEVLGNGKGIDCAGFVGGDGYDQAVFLSCDGSGNSFLGGITESTERTFPVKNGPRITFSPKGIYGVDAFVCKVRFVGLSASGKASPGGRVDLALRDTDSIGLRFQLGSSLGTGPISIDTRKIDLSPDNLLQISVVDLWPSIFQGYRGVIDSNGQAKAAMYIPNTNALIGIRVYTAFVTLDSLMPSGIKSISDTVSFTITSN